MDDENDLVMPHADSPYGYAARHAPRCGKDGRSDGAQGRGLYGKSGGGHKHDRGDCRGAALADVNDHVNYSAQYWRRSWKSDWKAQFSELTTSP